MTDYFLKHLRERYEYLVEYQIKTELKSINDVIKDMLIMLQNNKSKLGPEEVENYLEKIKHVKTVVDETSDAAVLHDILVSSVTPLYKQMKNSIYPKFAGVTLPTPKVSGGKQTISAYEKGVLKQRQQQEKPKSGIARLAARMARTDDKIPSEVPSTIDTIQDKPKSVNLSLLASQLNSVKDDLNPEDYANANNAISAAMSNPTPENISAAKSAVQVAFENS